MRTRVKNALPILGGFLMVALLGRTLWLSKFGLSSTEILKGVIEWWQPLAVFAVALAAVARMVLRYRTSVVVVIGAAAGCLWLSAWLATASLVSPFHNERGFLHEVWFWGVHIHPSYVYPLLFGVASALFGTKRRVAA